MDVALEHSKRQVNRAGKLLRDLRGVIQADDTSALNEFDAGEIHRAIEVVEWWRTMHSRPLARINANLRYYVRKAKAEPEVTQRLKRFATIVHMLEREPTMALTNMEDVGAYASSSQAGSRVFHVCDMLEKADRWTIRRRRFRVEAGDAAPKDDGYRAVHLIVVKDDFYVEIQLRTPWQDVWAQSVEQTPAGFGRASSSAPVLTIYASTTA